jgi:hypothetical protein
MNDIILWHLLPIEKMEDDAHIVQTKNYYHDIMIWRQNSQIWLKNGIMRKIEI